MGYWLWALIVIVAAIALFVSLYALAIWVSVREEPYLDTVWNVAKQIFTGEFWR